MIPGCERDAAPKPQAAPKRDHPHTPKDAETEAAPVPERTLPHTTTTKGRNMLSLTQLGEMTPEARTDLFDSLMDQIWPDSPSKAQTAAQHLGCSPQT